MKKAILGALFVGAMFASCSSDEPVINPDNGNNGENLGYVAVNIVQPKSIGTRAFGKDDFENGDDVENTAEKALFFVFNKTGNIIGDAQEIALTPTNNTSDINPAVEKIYKAVLVINGVSPKPTPDTEYQMVCVLNAPTGLTTVKTLKGLQDKIGDYRISSDNSFIMTNSVYKKGNDEVLGAIITDDNIKTSGTEAEKNPVDIYVERVVAKVTSNAPKEIVSNGATITDNKGAEKNFTIEITGIEIANIAATSYLFKNISDITYEWAWDADNKRSYWETIPSSMAYENQSYADIANGFNNANGLKTYIQPNTASQKANQTSVLVTAQLKEGNDVADLAYIRGQYTTIDGAMAVVAQAIANKFDYRKEVIENGETKYRQLDKNDFKWVNKFDEGFTTLTWLKDYEVIATLADADQKIYTVSTGENGKEIATEVTDKTEFETFLRGNATEASDYRARVYTDGKCYYFVRIDQTSVANGNGENNVAAHTYDGVVRNHVYKLNLQSIGGIGVPVFDPNDKIIPQDVPDEELFYVAAEINVLDWKIVQQNVNFQGK